MGWGILLRAILECFDEIKVRLERSPPTIDSKLSAQHAEVLKRLENEKRERQRERESYEARLRDLENRISKFQLPHIPARAQLPMATGVSSGELPRKSPGAVGVAGVSRTELGASNQATTGLHVTAGGARVSDTRI